MTPIHKAGGIYLKRDDLWRGEAPAQGAKARTATAICERAVKEGVTELNSIHDRNSSTPGVVARVCKHYGVALRLWVPASKEPLSPVFEDAVKNGAILQEVKPGYMSNRVKKATNHVHNGRGRVLLGIGLRWDNCGLAETLVQAANVLAHVAPTDEAHRKDRRVVVPVGSGVMFGFIARALPKVPLLGVCVGSVPRYLTEFPLPPWIELVQSRHDFHHEVEAKIGDVPLDPVYEAKCLEHLRDGDLLWIVAHRDTQ